MNEQKSDTTEQQKDIILYSAMVNAWVQTKMERDKTLISISAGGIGLLVTILSTVGVQYWWQILLYCCAFLSFCVVIIALIVIFDKNSKYIEKVIDKKASPDNKKDSLDNEKAFQKHVLKRLDSVSFYSFVLAVIFSIVIGIVAAIDKLGGDEVNEEKKTENSVQQIPSNESLDGISNLGQGLTAGTGSLAGIENLRPQPEQDILPEKAPSTSDSQVPNSKTGHSEQVRNGNE